MDGEITGVLIRHLNCIAERSAFIEIARLRQCSQQLWKRSGFMAYTVPFMHYKPYNSDNWQIDRRNLVAEPSLVVADALASPARAFCPLKPSLFESRIAMLL